MPDAIFHTYREPCRNYVNSNALVVEPNVEITAGIKYQSLQAEYQTVNLGSGAFIHLVRTDTEPGVLRLTPSILANPPLGYNSGLGWNMWAFKVFPSESSEPWVKIEVLGPAYTKQITVSRYQQNLISRYTGYGNNTIVTVDVTHSYEGDDYFHPPQKERGGEGKPYLYLKVRITALPASGLTGTIEQEIFFRRPDRGVVDLSKCHTGSFEVSCSNTFFGTALTWTQDVWTYTAFHHLLSQGYTDKATGGTDALWLWWLRSRGVNPDTRQMDGIKKVEGDKVIKPNLDRLAAQEPLLWLFFCWLHDKRTSDKTANNRLLATMLEQCGKDYDTLRAELRRVLDNVPKTSPEHEYQRTNSTQEQTLLGRTICLTFCGAMEKIEEAKAKSQWQFAKGARAKAEVLGISATEHPLLLAAIESGDIPINVFHEPGSEDTLINVEFDLWERSLSRPGWAPIMSEIAKSASGRSTYTKRVTSYFAFLFKIETYLNRHAPRPPVSVGRKAVSGTWKAMPKFVQSQMELEMDEATEEGTVKKRSALTPVADNDTGTITVPYVAMSVSGMRTTWCYSDRYYVAEEGLEDPFTSGVFDKDLNLKLNGRDDYGVMFYTLTGTDQNRGYPTFLIIMERTTLHSTRVHFHRVHPCRKRGPNGSATPPHRLINECYRYMAGTVIASEIDHQQGDLMLTYVPNMGDKVDAGVPCYGFENHSFRSLGTEPVKLFRSTAKTRGNVLGWLLVPEGGMDMPHPEHEPIMGMKSGIIQVRRSKSYENNPSGAWSYNVD